MKQMLLGLDGSRAGLAAARWSAGLAVATGSKLTVVHAFTPPYSEVRVGDLDEMLDARHTEVDRWVQPLADLGATIRTEVIEGDPRSVITELAEREDADLVVLGRSGHGGTPGFFHLGSVVEMLAHDAQRPLAVIPAETPPDIGRIMVGVDGSEESAAAVSWVAELAPLVGADVLAVTVEEPIAEWTPAWSDHNWRRGAIRDLESWTKPIAESGVELEFAPVENLFPADGLLGVATGRDVDLVVIGTRGAGGFAGLRFGGVAMKVLHRATVPLVLVPPPEER